MSFRFESQSGRIEKDPSPQAVDQLLALLDGIENTFASLTLDGASYVQTGGGPDMFTVEFRQFAPDGSFRHLKAFVPGVATGSRHLRIGDSDVSLSPNEILDLETTRQIFRAFLVSQEPDTSVNWKDITEMFAAA